MRELSRVMSFRVRAHWQVWLGVPVVPGVFFGSAATEALEQTVQARQTSQQLSGLRRSKPPPPPKRLSRPSVSPSARPPPRHVDRFGGFYLQEVQQRPGRDLRQLDRPGNPGRDPGSQGQWASKMMPPGLLSDIFPISSSVSGLLILWIYG
ncbi:hypothetical protein GOODEAATRI_034463 [Goodea atripinnis]|uniref:Uncharacterized protein n=1 Tax=Goodea atripinnis TaxID=208336 RepID=A0ABV0Q4C1_9TELE